MGKVNDIYAEELEEILSTLEVNIDTTPLSKEVEKRLKKIGKSELIKLAVIINMRSKVQFETNEELEQAVETENIRSKIKGDNYKIVIENLRSQLKQARDMIDAAMCYWG